VGAAYTCNRETRERRGGQATSWPEFVDAGGLMTYSDLRVERPTTFELLINLKTANHQSHDPAVSAGASGPDHWVTRARPTRPASPGSARLRWVLDVVIQPSALEALELTASFGLALSSPALHGCRPASHTRIATTPGHPLNACADYGPLLVAM